MKRGKRAEAGLYEESDFIRGRRLTNAEAWELLYPDVPFMSKEMEAIIEQFANVDHGQQIEMTPELLNQQDISK
jgi:hypothetical protein